MNRQHGCRLITVCVVPFLVGACTVLTPPDSQPEAPISAAPESQASRDIRAAQAVTEDFFTVAGELLTKPDRVDDPLLPYTDSLSPLYQQQRRLQAEYRESGVRNDGVPDVTARYVTENRRPESELRDALSIEVCVDSTAVHAMKGNRQLHMGTRVKAVIEVRRSANVWRVWDLANASQFRGTGSC